MDAAEIDMGRQLGQVKIRVEYGSNVQLHQFIASETIIVTHRKAFMRPYSLVVSKPQSVEDCKGRPSNSSSQHKTQYTKVKLTFVFLDKT